MFHAMGPGFGVEAAWLHLSTLLGVLADWDAVKGEVLAPVAGAGNKP